MNDAFAQVIGPVFQAVADVQARVAGGDHPPWPEVKDTLLVALAEAEQKASASRELAADFALTKSALVYWIDEVLINSSWVHAADWQAHILEWDFYRDRVGGEKFYELAEQAERLGGTDPLETFLLCVALGFHGKHGQDRAEVQKWVERAYGRVASAGRQPDRFLPDDPDEGRDGPLRPLPGKSMLLTVSVLVSATALVTLACFILAFYLG